MCWQVVRSFTSFCDFDAFRRQKPLSRVYFTCDACLTGEYALDSRLGVSEFVSPQARRLLALASASWSFAGAEKHLQEFCGLSVSASKVRAARQREGQ